MELLKDYDCVISYHPGKANAVVDVLSHKSVDSLTHISQVRRPLVWELHDLVDDEVRFDMIEINAILSQIEVRPSLVQLVKDGQRNDPKLCQLAERVRKGKLPTGKNLQYKVDSDETLRYED